MNGNPKYNIRIQSKVPNEAYKENWDKIFGKDKPTVPVYCRSCRELLTECHCRQVPIKRGSDES